MKRTFICFLILIFGCQDLTKTNDFRGNFPLHSTFKDYWFDGTAEISSYQLNQSRYGEPRQGQAVLIYVTEDFLTKEQVKANQKSNQSKLVLKLNRTKNFLTGIYPYSIMTSSFTYLEEQDPLVKISTSVQEWCGQAYLQLNKKNNLIVESHSYFEGEADQKINLKNGLTEDEIWHLVRTAPENLPLGQLKVLPALEYLRLSHKPIQFFDAIASLEVQETHSQYELKYPEINRKLVITFEKISPYQILGWEEIDLTHSENSTKARRIKTNKLPYWKLNHLGDERYRDSLGLN
jgi:hypothetical protein